MGKESRKGRLERAACITSLRVSVSDQYPPPIHYSSKIQAYKGRTVAIEITSNSKDVVFSLSNKCSGFELFGMNLWPMGWEESP